MKTTYECPKCNRAMVKQTGNWDIWHCVSCQYSYDAWSSEPQPKRIEVDQVEEYNAYDDMVIIDLRV